MKARLAQKADASTGISLKKEVDLGDCSLHGHDFYEVDIITAGRACAIVNGRSESAEAGMIYLLTPEDFHEYKDTDGLAVLNIQFFGDDVDSRLLRSLIDAKCAAFKPSDRDFRAVCELYEVMRMQSAPDAFSADILPRLLEAVLIILHKCLNVQPSNERVMPHDIQKALVYIQEHFKENPPLSRIAALLSLNERYFCTRFKAYTGKTYKEYLRQTKLRYARKLIMSTDISMTEICERCGYATQSHFNREFKAHFGTSPRELRGG